MPIPVHHLGISGEHMAGHDYLAGSVGFMQNQVCCGVGEPRGNCSPTVILLQSFHLDFFLFLFSVAARIVGKNNDKVVKKNVLQLKKEAA